MIRLEIRHLALVRSIGETSNVSATARELGVSQSAISHRMKEAERRVGTPVFYRDGHNISLTPSGRRLQEAANRILAEIARAERDVDQLSTGFDVVARIGAACYSGFDWFPALLERMQNMQPRSSAEIVPDVSEDPVNLIDNNLADIVLVAAKVERPDTICTPLVDDELVAVMSASHPLAAKDFVEPAAFESEIYVTHHTLPEKGREYDTIFMPTKILPRRVISAGRTQAVLNVVHEQHAVTVLPRLSVQTTAQRMGLCLLPITASSIKIRWYALTRVGARNSAVLGKTVEIIKDVLANRSELP